MSSKVFIFYHTGNEHPTNIASVDLVLTARASVVK